MICFQTKTMRHGSSRKCLAISDKKDKLLMETCDFTADRQRWKFGTFNVDKAREADLIANDV